jgi:hypothetical protein
MTHSRCTPLVDGHRIVYLGDCFDLIMIFIKAFRIGCHLQMTNIKAIESQVAPSSFPTSGKKHDLFLSPFTFLQGNDA